MQAYTGTPFWSLPNVALSWKYYLGPLHGSDDIPLYAAAGQADIIDS